MDSGSSRQSYYGSGKDLGKAIRGFREASKGDEEAKKEEEAEETVKTAATTKKKTKDSAKEA